MAKHGLGARNHCGSRFVEVSEKQQRMEILLYVVALSLGLSVTTVVHELGHILLAKFTSIHAFAFNIGFSQVVYEQGGQARAIEFACFLSLRSPNCLISDGTRP